MANQQAAWCGPCTRLAQPHDMAPGPEQNHQQLQNRTAMSSPQRRDLPARPSSDPTRQDVLIRSVPGWINALNLKLHWWEQRPRNSPAGPRCAARPPRCQKWPWVRSSAAQQLSCCVAGLTSKEQVVFVPHKTDELQVQPPASQLDQPFDSTQAMAGEPLGAPSSSCLALVARRPSW